MSASTSLKFARGLEPRQALKVVHGYKAIDRLNLGDERLAGPFHQGTMSVISPEDPQHYRTGWRSGMDSNPWFRLFSTKRPISATLLSPPGKPKGSARPGVPEKDWLPARDERCVCLPGEGAGRYEARSLRSACARSGGGVLLAEPFWTRVASSFDSASAASTIHYD